jgi:hypothetical protein
MAVLPPRRIAAENQKYQVDLLLKGSECFSSMCHLSVP